MLRSLQLLELEDFPDIIYIQVDGGPENWNECVFAVYMSRLAASKTHQDIDRAYSYINRELFGTGPGGRKVGKDVITREEFAKMFHSSLSDKKDTMLLKHVFQDMSFTFDFWSFFKPHFYKAFKVFLVMEVEAMFMF